MKQYGFLIDMQNCYGCKTCSMACKSENMTPMGVLWRRVRERHTDEPNTQAFISMSCNHCDSPICFEKCPQSAIIKAADTGLMSIDEEKCIGCGTCAIVCPYNAPKVDEEKKKAVRCNGCAERVAAGEKPVCVEACPARALDFGPGGDMEKLGERAAIAPFPRPAATVPNLFVKPSADARPAESKDGVVANLLEVGFRATDKEIME